jgi:hypothetical protein
MKASGWLGLRGDVEVSNKSTFECTSDIGKVGSSQINTGAKTLTKSSLIEATRTMGIGGMFDIMG